MRTEPNRSARDVAGRRMNNRNNNAINSLISCPWRGGEREIFGRIARPVEKGCASNKTGE